MERDKKSELLAKYEAGDETVYEEALALYEKALDEDPENTQLLHSYGFLYEKKGTRLLQKAAKIYEKGVRIGLQPDNINNIEKQHCHGQLIWTRAKLQENQKSIDLYKEYLQKYPDKPSGYIHLANAYTKAEQIEEAKLTIEAAYKLAPNDPSVNDWMGRVYERLGKYEEALEYFKTAIELDSIYISCRFSRAYLFEKLNKLDEALNEWNLIIKYLYENGFEIEAKFPEVELQRVQAKIKSNKK